MSFAYKNPLHTSLRSQDGEQNAGRRRRSLIVPGALKCECQVEPESRRKGEERRRGKVSGQAVHAAGALAFLRNSVEGRGSYEQANGEQHECERRRAHVAAGRRQHIEALAESALVLKTEQDLGAEDERPRLIKGRLHLSRESHSRLKDFHKVLVLERHQPAFEVEKGLVRMRYRRLSNFPIKIPAATRIPAETSG